jgi:hypothetical protein
MEILIFLSLKQNFFIKGKFRDNTDNLNTNITNIFFYLFIANSKYYFQCIKITKLLTYEIEPVFKKQSCH